MALSKSSENGISTPMGTKDQNQMPDLAFGSGMKFASDTFSSCSSYSVDDTSLDSGCKMETDSGMAAEKISQTVFLPTAKSHALSGTYCPDISCENNTEYWHESESSKFQEESISLEEDESFNLSFNSSFPQMQTKLIQVQDVDFVSLKEKLEAQKECLHESFVKQIHSRNLKRTFNTKEGKLGKSGSFKLKRKLSKLGQTACHFLNTKIFKQVQPTMQNCDIHLDGFDDRADRLILVIYQQSVNSTGRQAVSISLPSLFDMSRVSVPVCLLPTRRGEMITVTVLGVSGQVETSFAGFGEVLVSGVCTVQYDSRSLLSGRVELQPHRPFHALTGFSKMMQIKGSRVEMRCNESNNYTFSTHPCPVAIDFTELCVLQMAAPFREFLSLSASSCDQPAVFRAQLSAGQYAAVSVYRLVSALPDVFSAVSAAPLTFFKAYMDKASVKQRLKQAVDLTDRCSSKKPRLLPSLTLLRPQGLGMDSLMRIIHRDLQTPDGDAELQEEAVYLYAFNTDSTDVETTILNNAWSTVKDVTNSQQYRTRGKLLLPSLSVFNINSQLYFGDYWSCYDQDFVTLVLCSKGSACHEVCKQCLPRLDPYNNPFLFRKRCLDPEPSVSVYASPAVNLQIIYTHSGSVHQMVAACSDKVFFSKMCVRGKRDG